MEERHLYLVMGMHRSGTSLIARALMSLGLSIGPDAAWKGSDNPLGFHEDRDAFALDERALRLAGWTWDKPGLPRVGGPTDVGAWKMLDWDIRTFLLDRLTHSPRFVLKEPRMCRLLPLWREVIHELGIPTTIVHVVRHPMAVARSLEKRNGLPIKKGLALWYDHVSSQGLEADDNWRSALVIYEDFMSDPSRSMMRLCEDLHLLPTRDMEVFLRDYCREELWHHRPTREDDEALSWKAPLPVAELWNQCKRGEFVEWA